MYIHVILSTKLCWFAVLQGTDFVHIVDTLFNESLLKAKYC